MARRGRPIDAVPLLLMGAMVVRLATGSRRAPDTLVDLPMIATAPFPASYFWIAAAVVGLPLLAAGLVSAFLRRDGRPIVAFHGLAAALVLLGIFAGPDLELRRGGDRASTDLMAMLVVSARLEALAERGILPEEQEVIENTLDGLPPLSRGGERWRIERASCGSAEDLPQRISSGTVVYCVGPGARRAYLAWDSGTGEAAIGSGSPPEADVERVNYPVLRGTVSWLPIEPPNRPSRR